MAVVGINDFDVSICCISFSKADGGALLLAIDEAPDHTISVWDWQKGEHGNKITETKVCGSRISYQVCFMLSLSFSVGPLLFTIILHSV